MSITKSENLINIALEAKVAITNIPKIENEWRVIARK